MIRLNFRLNRTMIIWWSLGLWTFLAATPPAYLQYYPTLADRGPLVDGMRDNMGTRAMYGFFPPPGTIGQFTTWETGAWTCVLAAVMGVLLITAMHRGAELRGEAELFQSAGVPRSRILSAALVTSILIAVMVGVGSTLILLALRYVSTDEITIEGSVTYGMMTTLTMVGFIALTSILQSLWGRNTNLARLGLLSIAVAFLLRMFADTYDSALTDAVNWISPLGWRTVIMPFTDDDWVAIGLLTVACAALLTVALLLDRIREFNSALIPARSAGRSRPRRIGGLIGLNLLTSRGATIAWSLTCGIIIVSILPLVDSLIPLIEQEDSTLVVIQQLLPEGELQTEFIIYVFQMVAVLVAVAVTQPLVGYISDEKTKLIDAVRAVGVPRYAPLLGAVVTASVNAISCAALATVGGLIALRIQSGEVEDGDAVVLTAGFSMVLQTFIFVGIATLLAGWAPRLIQLAWVPVVAAASITTLGLILGLSETQIDLSPLSHTLTVTGENMETLRVFAWLGLIGVFAGLIGAWKREIR